VWGALWQNLACGLFEMRSKEGGASSTGATPSDDDDDDDDDAQPLRLPSQQTAAVAAAKRVGRTLVSEVGAEEPEAAAKRAPKKRGGRKR